MSANVWLFDYSLALPFFEIGMETEDIMLSEMSDRERQTSYDLTYMWNLKQKQLSS